MLFVCCSLVEYVDSDRFKVFVFSVLLDRSHVVYVVQVASSGYTLFFLVWVRLDGFHMFWRVPSCLRSMGCILVAHVFKSDSDSFRLAGLDYFKMCFLCVSCLGRFNLFSLVFNCLNIVLFGFCFSLLLLFLLNNSTLFRCIPCCFKRFRLLMLFQIILGCFFLFLIVF